MLYLEDYVEMIEHLPQELRDRCTEMRELDLQVQNSVDSLEKRVHIFFNNAKKMKPNEKDLEYEALRQEYLKALDDADEKVQLANNMYELVTKYYKRLEQELHKFKMELEADNMGITEILEKRSHDKDPMPTNSSQKENRYCMLPQRSTYYGEKRRESGEVKSQTARQEKEAGQYSLGHMGAGRTAIAAAASQAIAATQQMQQGRRTASLKASYEAIGGVAVGGGSVSAAAVASEISKEIAGAAQSAIAAIQDTHKKHKSSSGGVSGMRKVASPAPSLPSPDTPASTSDRNSSDAYDPNEPRYCICNEVAFGTMVACDNKTCPYEWYHYPCVGITEKPKGKWYCPHCTAAMKRRRKN